MIVFDGMFTGIAGALAVAAFVVVFAVCLRVLPEMGFTGTSQEVLAFCVAALSAIGIVAFGPGTSSHGPVPQESSTFHFVLLPYAALGLTLLLLILFLLLAGWYERLKEAAGRFEEWKRPEREKDLQKYATRVREKDGPSAQRRRWR